MGLEAWGGGGTEKEKEKIPHTCESIGHRPLRGRSANREKRKKEEAKKEEAKKGGRKNERI